MAAQKGKDLLLKVDGTGTGTFTTIAGLRSRTLAFNAETVDITHAESSGQWRELLSGAGARSARITGAGPITGSTLMHPPPGTQSASPPAPSTRSSRP